MAGAYPPNLHILLTTTMTDIQKYTIQNPLTVAEHFAKSGLFEDSKDLSKALVKILAGRELGLTDMTSMTGIHIIKGKPVLGANLIASLIKKSNKYDFKTIELTDEKAVLEFYENGLKVGTSEFSKKDAEKAGTQNMGKFPKNMLFARAVSNGAKWFCSDVFNGQTVYSEGELDNEKAEPVEEKEEKEETYQTIELTIDDSQLKAFRAKKEKMGWTEADIEELLRSNNISSLESITKSQFPKLFNSLVKKEVKESPLPPSFKAYKTEEEQAEIHANPPF